VSLAYSSLKTGSPEATLFKVLGEDCQEDLGLIGYKQDDMNGNGVYYEFWNTI
jgi:hypothetical protein